MPQYSLPTAFQSRWEMRLDFPLPVVPAMSMWWERKLSPGSAMSTSSTLVPERSLPKKKGFVGEVRNETSCSVISLTGEKNGGRAFGRDAFPLERVTMGLRSASWEV